MSEPIRVGDLVMVVRGVTCCGHLSGCEGYCFTVSAIVDYGRQRCIHCLRLSDMPGAAGCPARRPIDIDRLRRIDPESAPESITTDEGVTA